MKSYYIADDNGTIYAHDIDSLAKAEATLSDALTAHPEYEGLGLEVLTDGDDEQTPSTVIDEWKEDGGILWAEEDATWPHTTRLYTTNDEGVIEDMFAAYDGDLTRGEWEKWLCRSALSIAGYTDEEIESELATW